MDDAKEKIVIMSYSTKVLDLIEELLQQREYKFSRIDGKVNSSNIINQFNKPKSEEFVLLSTAQIGGVGLNLIGVNRLIMFDASWNPALDEQVNNSE